LLILLNFAGITQAAPPGDQTTFPRGLSSEQSNKGVVGVVAGGVNGTYIRIAADMATALDTNNLRILAIIGKGSIQNINDLLYLKGVDMAIVQSDVLEYLRRQGTPYNIEKRIHYITKLYNEEFHLLAKSGVENLNDLSGRKVNFDTKGSGTFITASIVFDILKITVEPTYYDQATALEKLKSGEIDALVYVAGKPTPLFDKLTTADSLRFVPIDHTPALLTTYLPTRLGSQDYPSLIKPDQDVKTVAVGAVLAVYGWERKSARYQKVANFVNHFFSRFNELQQPARHPKWREVSLSALIPGWTRFQPAREWLERQQ
jgi:TRAP transporter TAXI family solute receptor